MRYLLDTNILVRLANAADVRHSEAILAVLKLHRGGQAIHSTSQVLIEFRNVATRPVALNGLGLPSVDAAAQTVAFEAQFPLLPGTPDILPSWKAIVDSFGVIGKQVHDACLVAVCHVHALTHLLTFNVAHFARLATFGQGVIVVDPTSV